MLKHLQKNLIGLFLVLFFFPIVLQGQQNYYITDSSKVEGVSLITGGNMINYQYCQILDNDKIIKLTPDEVKEYGFDNGKVFVSKEIEDMFKTKRVFLELLSSGDINLYFYENKYRKVFYLERENTFIDLMSFSKDNEQDLKETLFEWTQDCSEFEDVVKYVHYNKESLRLFIDKYNNCELKSFPRPRFGITVGYEFSKLMLSSITYDGLNSLNSEYSGGITGGILLDVPVFIDIISLHTEVVFSKNIYSYSGIYVNKEVDLLASIYVLKYPVLLRYSHNFNNIRPFADIGFEGAVVLKKEEASYFKTSQNTNLISISSTDISSVINTWHMGYAFGAGFEYRLNSNLSLLFEMRYTTQYGLTSPDSFKTNYFEFSTGIIF